MQQSIKIDFMEMALAEARKGEAKGEVPIGAVGVIDGKAMARSHNRRESRHDPLGHAEIDLIQKISRKLDRWRLTDLTVYVTLEPCLMCLGALIQARIAHLVYGADDPVAGAFSKFGIQKKGLPFDLMEGIKGSEAGFLLQSFFRNRRLEPILKPS